MVEESGNFQGGSGHSIHYRCWLPEGEAVALLLLVHGAGEHSERYAALAEYCTGRRYAVAALDQHGHGRSAGRPGYVASFEDFVTDLDGLCNEVGGRFAALPRFLVGHSLGGLVAGLYLLRAQAAFAGAVFSGPLVLIDPEPGAVRRALIRVLGTLVPRLGVLQLDPAGVSRDPAVVEAYARDPLVFHGRMSARQLREMFAAMDALRAGAGGIRLPVLLLHGGADRMTSPRGSQFLYDNVSSADRTLRIYPGLYHEIFNEPERREVWDGMLDWCDAHRPGEG